MKRIHESLAAATMLLAILFLSAAPAGAGIEGSTWFPMGPAPIDGFFTGGATGRATAIAVNSANTDEIWLGTAGGGVWHTLDAGDNWEPESDREDSLAIGAIALDGCAAAGCSTIYAGTGENGIRRDTYYGAGLLIGKRVGTEISWTRRTGSPFNFRLGAINDVVLDPTTKGSGKRIFVTFSSGQTLASPGSTVTSPSPHSGYGIFRSDDNGVSWSKLAVAGAGEAKPTDLEMQPKNHNILFAGFSGRGVFRSTDGGNHWCPLNAGIPKPVGCPAQSLPLPSVDKATFDHVEIAIAPSNPQITYVTLGMCADPLIQSCRPAVFLSGNGGITWKQKIAGDPDDASGAAGTEAYVYSRYTHALAVDPTNPEVLLLGGVGLWRSTDGGLTFNASDANLALGTGISRVHFDHHEVVFDPAAPNRVYSADDGGFAVSTDGGQHWTPRNDDLQITGFQSLGSSPKTMSVIGGSQDNAAQLWSGNRRWKHLNCCGDGGYSIIDFDDPQFMYVGANFGQLLRSKNAGNSWEGINNGIPSTDPRLFYAPFIQDTGGNGHPLYFGTNRLFRSTTHGDSWTAVSPVLAIGGAPDIVTGSSAPSHFANPGRNVITAIAVAPSDPNRIYVGYYGGQVFRSNAPLCEANACWTAIEAGLPNAPVSRIAVHPTNPNLAYATFSGFGNFSRVWKTTNGGAIWSPVASGLPVGVPATTVSIEPSVPQRVYVGLDSGLNGASLFRSTDGGGVWSAFSQGLPNAPVYEISIDETHGRMYAATHGRGAFVLGKPFINTFEGCVDGGISNIAVFGQNFLSNQASCTLRVLQTDGTVCASGTIDAMGGKIRTDAGGVLETNLLDMFNNKKVAWGCLNGICLGGTPIAQCNDDADGDGDLDPLSTVTVKCGDQMATSTVTGCPPLDNPPTTVMEINLLGLMGSGKLTAAEGTLHLIATAQRRVGTESLCAVSVRFRRGETDEAVLARSQAAVAASSTCAAKGVRAVLDAGHAGPSEDEFERRPRLLLEASGVTGSQLIIALHADPGASAGACVRLGELGVPVLNQLQALKIRLLTSPEGAAGGSLTLVEQSSLGACALTVPTVAGQSGAEIAAAVDAAVHAPGIPGPHPRCPADHNPRDIVGRSGFLLSAEASSIELCVEDPKVGFDLRTKELANAHPIADAGDDRKSPPGAVVLDGSRSADPDSTPGTNDDVERFEWFDVTGGAPVALGSGRALAVPLAVGRHRLRLRVTDRGGLTDMDEVLVRVGG